MGTVLHPERLKRLSPQGFQQGNEQLTAPDVQGYPRDAGRRGNVGNGEEMRFEAITSTRVSVL